MEFLERNTQTKIHSLREEALRRGLGSRLKDVPKFSGTISGKLWAQVRDLNSSLPDTFDWSIYDSIFDRFGENQPRGGVVFKTALKLVNHHSTCTRCHYSFEIDTYGRGCIHNCVYCYAKEALTQHGYWNQPMPFPLDLAQVRKFFYLAFETDRKSKWGDILRQRVPLRVGSMSDAFMFMDRKFGVTKELLRILRHYQYPHVIFTRSDLVAHEEYLPLLDPEICSVQMSISGENETLTRALEPGAPSVKRRLQALRKLTDAGIWNAVRLNPLFPTFPDGYFSDRKSIEARFGSKKNVPSFDLLDIRNIGPFMDQISETGTKTVIAGFIRLSKYAIIEIRKATNIDLKPFFRTDIPQDARDKRYTDSEISFYYKTLQSAAAERGLRFTTCYIGNGIKDYFQYQPLWSNVSDCCDLRGNLERFKSSSQELPWDVRIKHASDPVAALEAQKLDLSMG